MNSHTIIPFEWRKYENQVSYFVTYFGDIYHGYLVELPNYHGGFFIVSKNEIIRLKGLPPQEKTPERYRELGWEIKKPEIIRCVVPDEDFQPMGYTLPFIERLQNGNHRFKKLFVFGAAASAFCVFGDRAKIFRESKLNPPTGFEIFDEKYDKYCRSYPSVMQSVSMFEAKGKDIEACMEEEWRQFKSSYNPRVVNRHINIQYYMRELFQDISNYVEKNHWRNNLYSLFANKIQKYTTEKGNQIIGIVSFNYDTILERFIGSAFGFRFYSMDDYVSQNDRGVQVFKPHGSVNWGWKFRDTVVQGFGQRTASEFLWEKQIEPYKIYYELLDDLGSTRISQWGVEKELNSNNLGRYTLNKNLLKVIMPEQRNDYLPALLLPYRDKDEFVMPYNHYQAMNDCFGEMEELYLIGWKGNERLFNKQIGKYAQSLKKIIIVNPCADDVIKNIKSQTKLDLSKYDVELVKDFEHFVLENMDKALKN